MAQAGTPLTASWLAARVFPLANNHILNHIHGSDDHTEWEPEELRIDQAPWLKYVYVEPHVLRSHRETFSWLNNATRVLVLWYSASWSIMVVGVRAQQPTSLGPLALRGIPIP